MNLEQAMYVNHEAVHLAMAMCCGGDAIYKLRRPFRQGRDVYATNGIIIARVPCFAMPWVTEADEQNRHYPGCLDLPWAPEKYCNVSIPWPKFPKPIVPLCDRCEEIKGGGYDPDSKPSFYELLDFADPPQICRKCGMYTASEVGSDYEMGFSWFNTRQCRKLATLGAVMFPPVSGKPLDAWRFEVLELKIVGLLMPVIRGET